MAKFGSVEYILERLEALKEISMQEMKQNEWMNCYYSFHDLYCRFTGMMEVICEEPENITMKEMLQVFDRMYVIGKELREYEHQLSGGKINGNR